MSGWNLPIFIFLLLQERLSHPVLGQLREPEKEPHDQAENEQPGHNERDAERHWSRCYTDFFYPPPHQLIFLID